MFLPSAAVAADLARGGTVSAGFQGLASSCGFRRDPSWCVIDHRDVWVSRHAYLSSMATATIAAIEMTVAAAYVTLSPLVFPVRAPAPSTRFSSYQDQTPVPLTSSIWPMV